MSLRALLATSVAVVACTLSSAAHADVNTCADAAERAQPLRARGRLLDARKELILCSASTCPKVVLNDCARWLAELEEAMPSVIFKAQDRRGSDVAGVTVSIDGVAIKNAFAGSPVSVDPGEHRVVFRAAGYDPVEQQLVLRQGEHLRPVGVVMAAPRAPSPRPEESRREESRPASAPRHIPVVSLVLTGAALALGATGAVLWVRGKSEHDGLADSCAPTSTCQHNAVVAARTKLIAGDVLVASGLLALGAGVVVTLTARRQQVTVAASGTSVTAAVRF